MKHTPRCLRARASRRALVSTTDLVEHARATRLTTTLWHPTREIREANWDAEHGAAESYERLARLLAER